MHPEDGSLQPKPSSCHPWTGGHLSSPDITIGIKRPTRGQARRLESPYLALLRMGFCRRCVATNGRALLPPDFTLARILPQKDRWRCPFCSTVRRVTPPGRYPASCLVELGLSSPISSGRPPGLLDCSFPTLSPVTAPVNMHRTSPPGQGTKILPAWAFRRVTIYLTQERGDSRMVAEGSHYREREIMPYPICHECAHIIELEVSTYWSYHGSVTCPTCKARMNIVTESGKLLESKPFIDRSFVVGIHKAIPAQPLGDYQDAVNCLAYRLWKPSAVMARRSLQGALLLRGVPEETPQKMVQWAVGNGILGAKQERLANTVIFFGGKGAHPEETSINEVGELEATQGLRVTKELLLALFPPPPPAPPQRFLTP